LSTPTLASAARAVAKVRPPQNQNDATAEALLNFAKCFGARERHEVYLSAPITTGQAFVAWRHSQGAEISRDHPHYEELHHEYVVSTNLTRVAPLVRQLRTRFADRLVIDPTALASLSGWEQENYHRLWGSFIDKYVALVIFADGWQFSTGCVREFGTALHLSIKTVDQSLRPLAPQDGERLVKAAIAEFRRLQVDPTGLLKALQSATSS
jgi:hypothetical protein